MRRLTYLIRFLEARDQLSDAEKAAIEALPWRVKNFAANETIIHQGSKQEESCLVLEGFAARSQLLAEGTRQLTAVHVPGDFVDLHAFMLKIMDHDVVALTACTVSFVPHQSLTRISEALPHLSRLFWLSTTIDAAIQRSWMTSMGRRSAKEQLAHLICELFVRLKTVGLTIGGDRYEMPITQADLSDIMGLSPVHVNRTLQGLRGEGAVTWEGKLITIRDWDRLQSLAQFDPTYLNLVQMPR